jgi:colanic acid/amylovoran biosynthesis glycosyltransferase
MTLTGNVSGLTNGLTFLASIVTTIGFIGFGYLTNDVSDREKDALAGKANAVQGLSNFIIGALFVLFLVMAFAPWLYLPLDEISLLSIVLELSLFILYAFPPFRLKERGVLGVITDALYAHVLPGFLAAWTFYLVGGKFYENFFLFAIALIIWQFFSGVRNIVSHHFKDFENDIASGTSTFGTAHGKEKIYLWMSRYLIPLEVLSFLFFLFVVQLELDLLVIVVVVFLLFAGSNFVQIKDNCAETNAKYFTNEFLDRFYIKWFPCILLAVLAFGNTFFWWLPILHMLAFYPIVGTIRKWFSSKRIENHEQQETLNKTRTIAILSTNRNNYSETFIHGHIQHLPNAVVYTDGYFPQSISVDRGKTWSKISERHSTEDELMESWKLNGVEVVLAEYGLAGVEVMNACERAKLPLIVHFHGFDAYRDDVLNGPGQKYPELFKKAAKIVVVSSDMLNQLIQLGCPEAKIEWITYGVDTSLFCPNPGIVERKHFIACGRFVEKKSPLTTLRAFALVLEKHPDARLTWIGDGELLETTIELSEELGIRQYIDFKGVLSPAALASEMQQHAIFVQHSIRAINNDSEGTPLSILEAAASGLAIVSTRHAGIVDILVEQQTGILVQEGDMEGMAQEMIRLLGDKERIRSLGQAARKSIVSGYNVKNYHAKLAKLVQDVQVSKNQTVESKLTVWKYRVLVFFVLFFIAEIGLRSVGSKSGVIEDFYFHSGTLEYDSILYADEVGITHLTMDAQIINNNIINTEGFLSKREYTQKSMADLRKSGKKIVMLVGDSYTQGCCADSYNESFAYLLNESEEYEVLNFGIPGADPVQYRLIVEKYAPLLQPDLIIIAVYGGNDILEYDRTAKPFIPLAYPVKSGPWLNSEGPIYLTESGTYFKNFEEAKAHYFDYFSLWSNQSSFTERIIRNSVILSRPYMKWKTKKRFKEIKHHVKTSAHPPFSQEQLLRIFKRSEELKIPVVFSLIPSPNDINKRENVTKKYGFLFGDLPWISPKGLVLDDYDGMQDANHFNSKGHRKFAYFLQKLIEGKLQK